MPETTVTIVCLGGSPQRKTSQTRLSPGRFVEQPSPEVCSPPA